jgi:hypothetical protein
LFRIIVVQPGGVLQEDNDYADVCGDEPLGF